MALSKIYKHRLQQLHEDLDRSIIKKVKIVKMSSFEQHKALDVDFGLSVEANNYVAHDKVKNMYSIENKIELFSKLEKTMNQL